MNDSIKCSICGHEKAMIFNTAIGIVVMCEDCIELGNEAANEARLYGKEMDICNPITFKLKPAKSKLWLFQYFNIHECKIH